MVQYLNNNLPGIVVPRHLEERMKGKKIDEGIKIARELISEIKKNKEVSGLHIFPLREMSVVSRLFD